VRAKEREPRPLKIARLDADERSSGSDSSLERLVASVFLYLVTLALGFALAWYIFPRVVVMPVLVDPQTGQLIDPQTGRVVADPQVADKPDSNKTQSSLPNQSGRKGDNAQPK
jgi:hypothetical protein